MDAEGRGPGWVGLRVSAVVSVLASAVIVAALAGAHESQRPAEPDLEAYYPAALAGGLTPSVALARLAALKPAPTGPAPAECFARNDALEARLVPGWDGDRWSVRGGRRVADRVVTAMFGMAGGKGPGALAGGFLAWESDPANSRVVLMIDPTVLDLSSVRRDLDRVALRAYRTAKARGPKVAVVVQEGCFTGAELAEARALAVAALNKATRDDPRRRIRAGLNGIARMDSRIHMRLGHGDRSWGEDLERRLGGRLAVEFDPLFVHE